MALISNAELKKLLEEYGLVPKEDLEDAYNEAETKSSSMSEIILDKGMISDAHLGQVIADYLKIPFINLSNTSVKEEDLRVIPEVVAKRQAVVCFETGPGLIKIAMADPTNIEVPRLLEKKTGEKVEVYYATERAIREAIRNYHKDLQHEFETLIKARLAELEAPTEEGLKEVPIINIVDTIMEYGYFNRASDVHIEPQERHTVIRFRIDGLLHDVLAIPKSIHDLLVTRIKILAELKTDDHFSAQDGRFSFVADSDKVDVRVSVVPITEGEKVVMRLLSEKTRQFNLEDLGFGPKELELVRTAVEKPHGMILACGPTGSGKTTTLYALLKIINRRDINIASIEDPVEYDVEGVNQIQVNTRTNLTYAAGLKSILRQDPDVIMVGEIRDPETAEVARVMERLINAGHKIIFATSYGYLDEAIKLGDRVAVMRAGRLVQFAPPGELLARPADEFVSEFIGSDRGLKRLALLTVGGADVDTRVERSAVPRGAPVLPAAMNLRDALSRLLVSEAQSGVVMDGDRYVGVLTLAKIAKMLRGDEA